MMSEVSWEECVQCQREKNVGKCGEYLMGNTAIGHVRGDEFVLSLEHSTEKSSGNQAALFSLLTKQFLHSCYR